MVILSLRWDLYCVFAVLLPTEMISFFDTVHIKVFTAAGVPLIAKNIGSIRLPQSTDYVPLTANELIGKAYEIHLRGKTLFFFDRCGNAQNFEGLKKREIRVEITFDDTREHIIRIASEYEANITHTTRTFSFVGRRACRLTLRSVMSQKKHSHLSSTSIINVRCAWDMTSTMMRRIIRHPALFHRPFL